MKLSFVFAVFLLGVMSQPTTVPEGFVGVTFSFGALANYTLTPGMYLNVPLVRTIYPVQINQQTDVVADIKCGTKSGVPVKFKEIFVVNILDKHSVVEMVRNYTVNYDQELIFKRVEHELCQFCSTHTLDEVYITQFSQIDEALQATLQTYINTHSGGLTILSVRITKPSIPETMDKEYNRIATQETIRRGDEKEFINTAERLRSVQDREKMSLHHQHEQELLRLEAQLVETRKKEEIAQAENAILKLKADQEFYSTSKRNEVVLQLASSQGYVAIEVAKAMGSNQILYFGDSVPPYFMPGLLPAPLAKKPEVQ